jgi:alcohol dehydrogenase class IV
MYAYDFRTVSYPLRLYSGRNALENLPQEIKRVGARRAFIVCGRTVSRKTGLIERIRCLLGEAAAGVFDEIGKDSTLDSILRARDAAREAKADLVIAVGAGSVLQAARIVVILLAETRPIAELVTQYPQNAPAISPRLLAPKLPIINVLTAPTTAQNRAGSGAKDEAADHRLEFFDPKTRPIAIFWDSDALLTAPPAMVRAAAATIFWRAVMNLGAAATNPLVEGDRLQAFRLSRNALARVTDGGDAAARIDLCAAAFLQNREADDGGSMFAKHWVSRVVYAFATALFNLHPQVSQGEATSAFTGTVMRRLGARNPREMAQIARALKVWDGIEASAHLRAADALDEIFRQLGMPVRVGALGVPQNGADRILEHALKNFNADPNREFVRERELLRDVLLASW